MLKIQQIFKDIEEDIAEIRNTPKAIQKAKRLRNNALNEYMNCNIIDLSEYYEIREYQRMIANLKSGDKIATEQTKLTNY